MRMTAVVVLCLIIGAAAVVLTPTAHVANNRTEATAPASGGQSVDHGRIRAALFNAAYRLESSPCDDKLREALRAAMIDYAVDIQRTGETPDSSVRELGERIVQTQLACAAGGDRQPDEEPERLPLNLAR
jgi:hypothetical protein